MSTEKEDKKFVVNFPENTTVAEVTVREGDAVKLIEPKPPVKTQLSGVIGVPVEYLKKRVGTGQFSQERSHLIVNREKISLILVINEDDEYLRGIVEGRLSFHPKFSEFGINTGKVWTPAELGLFFKMNRVFFADKAINMKLVTDLMNFTATVNNKIERSIKESGDRADVFVQTVNSNLPPSFTLNIPIFKGMPAETLEVETFAKINGREVSFTLLSPGANQTLEEIRDRAIDSQLEEIREIASDIAIIEE
ncbi:MAG: hypothetical protein LBJ17_08650 [Dysgonamonadaceae bacterium]|jgi:hypothetical protein|nr:hypothetical protein [Dysgonamonadaceae bacterium]